MHLANLLFSPPSRRSEFLAMGALSVLVLGACGLDRRTLHLDTSPIPLLPNAQGFIDGSNAAGIVGSWFFFSDSVPGSSGQSCEDAGFSEDQCSKLVTPTGPIFTPSDLSTGSMCTSGVAAQLINDPTTMMPAYGEIYGVGIGFNLNNSGARLPYDAPAHGITGFSFVIDSPPLGALQVGLLNLENPGHSAYWGGATAADSPVVSGPNQFRWPDVGGPLFLAEPPPFDPSSPVALTFQVVSIVSSAIPFSFCISQVMALRD